MSRIKATTDSITGRARRSARGSLPPAGVEPEPQPGTRGPDGRDRRLLRQRLRRTRRVREARLAELGVLVMEMQRRGRWNAALVEEWTTELELAGRENRELDEALRGARTLDELVASGLVAQCAACGRIAGGADSYCAGCGRELGARSKQPAAEDGKTLTIP